jgi:hypothetical protein
MTKDVLIAVFIKRGYSTAIRAFDDVVRKTREIIRQGRSNERKSSTEETLLNELQ